MAKSIRTNDPSFKETIDFCSLLWSKETLRYNNDNRGSDGSGEQSELEQIGAILQKFGETLIQHAEPI